ncbi:MAG TPA: hypothetical protein VHB79_34100 [Polyangiaceae bacterium]|nr:hypothetical protein [Polyangiaceae bacterium]
MTNTAEVAEVAQTTTTNARVGAVALAASAFITLLLSHVSASLAPLRLLTLALSAFAAWSFCDEMGLRKPLNRAGFVVFIMAMAAKLELILGVDRASAGRYGVLFASFLLLSLVFWSAAFLHRQRTLKVVGAVGLVVSLTPIIALVVGHLVVGAGAFLGVSALLSAGQGGALDTSFLTLVERLFGLWGYAAAWLLWRGHIRSTATVS